MKNFEDELNPSERARFAALSMTRASDEIAEDRTVALLRRRGLLRSRHSAGPAVLRAFLMLAASILIFAGGIAFGRNFTDQYSGEAIASEVQRTGSAYVAALIKLSRVSSRDSAQVVAAGLETASATLRAAAASAARIHPEDASVVRIRDGLEIGINYVATAPRGNFTRF